MKKHRALTFAILAIALILRLIALFIYPDVPQLRRLVEEADALDYYQLAHSLSTSGVFGYDPAIPTAFRMPGYPLLLALLYTIKQTPFLLQLLQILADLLTVWFVIEIGKKLFPQGWVPYLAALIVAVHPLLIITSIAIYPETITIFLISLGTLFIVKYSDSKWLPIFSAVPLTISVYFKPTMFAVAFAILAMISIRRMLQRESSLANRAGGLLPFLIMAIILSPWVIRNARIMDAFIPLTTSSGFNLHTGNNPQADGSGQVRDPYVIPNMSEPESGRAYAEQAMQWIREHPIELLKLLPRKCFRFIWPLSHSASGIISVPKVVYFLVLAGTIVFYGSAILGAYFLFIMKRVWETAILLMPFLALLFSSLVAFGGVRFCLPAIPNLSLLIALGLDTLILKRFSAIR